MTESDMDWELSGEFYHGGEEEKKLSLEDFVEESGPLEFDGGSDEQFTRTVTEVRQVLTLSGEGKDISEVASVTGLEKQYVYDILVCAQGFREDDEIAVAHLVLG